MVLNCFLPLYPNSGKLTAHIATTKCFCRIDASETVGNTVVLRQPVESGHPHVAPMVFHYPEYPRIRNAASFSGIIMMNRAVGRNSVESAFGAYPDCTGFITIQVTHVGIDQARLINPTDFIPLLPIDHAQSVGFGADPYPTRFVLTNCPHHFI